VMAQLLAQDEIELSEYAPHPQPQVTF